MIDEVADCRTLKLGVGLACVAAGHPDRLLEGAFFKSIAAKDLDLDVAAARFAALRANLRSAMHARLANGIARRLRRRLGGAARGTLEADDARRIFVEDVTAPDWKGAGLHP